MAGGLLRDQISCLKHEKAYKESHCMCHSHKTVIDFCGFHVLQQLWSAKLLCKLSSGHFQ